MSPEYCDQASPWYTHMVPTTADALIALQSVVR